MKSQHSPFPTYKLKRETPCNKFQNKYRDEIKELISGTEYLDQFINNKYKKPTTETRNENSPRNFNSMTPEAKRKLMFQRPVTLIKRQTKYYSNHAKTPTKSAKNDEKPNFVYFAERNDDQNLQISPKNSIDQLNAEMPLFKLPDFNGDIQTTPQKKNKSATQILEQEKQDEFDSYSFDVDDLIDVNSNSNLKKKLNKLNKENESKKTENDLKEKKNKKISQNNFQFSNQKENDSNSFETDDLIDFSNSNSNLKISNLNQEIECKTIENKNKRMSQNSIQSFEQENQKELDSNSFETDELFGNSNVKIKNKNLNQQIENKKTEKKNKGFNYFQASFDQDDQSDDDDEISDPQTELIDDEINSISEISDHVENERRISLSHKKALIMVSTDAIEAEVNFTSDSSSSDFEFQSQFFVQEKVVKPDTLKNKNIENCGKFISSEAIESFSDE